MSSETAIPVAGIVAEYNPFHCGHAWHIAETKRRLGGCAIVCVMSGTVTQRGEPAIMGKHARARAAIQSGADLIIELPSEYACASAERFAKAAVTLLKAMGIVSYLSFGSELGALTELQALADAKDDADFMPESEAALPEGGSYAEAWQAVFEQRLGKAAAAHMKNANNLLGVCYLSALRGTGIVPLTVKRRGAAHDGEPNGGFAPASYIRKQLMSCGTVSYVTPETAAVFANEKETGRAPVSFLNNERGLLTLLRRMPPDAWLRMPDVGSGLEHRLCKAAARAEGYNELLNSLSCKRYAAARMRRIVACAYFGITKERQQAAPEYLRILAANKTGLGLLAAMRKKAELPVINKPAKHKDLLAFESSVTDAAALLRPAISPKGEEWTTGPVVL